MIKSSTNQLSCFTLAVMLTPRTDYDSPWKEILESYFDAFTAFFFPVAHGDIDWQRGYEFLDKELQQVVREAEVGKRLADKLVKVWNGAGEQIWVLIHIEVQSQPESGFAERMYTYNYRLRDRFNRPVASFAVLGDDSATWRPERFEAELWGCQTCFQFPTVKLLDYEQRWSALEASDNIFATVVMAHLKTLATQSDAIERQQWKVRLAKRLFQKGLDRQAVIDLIRFIDWLLVLPDDLEQDFWEVLQAQEVAMKYVTTLERFAEARGLQEGLQEGRQEGRQEGLEKERALIVRQLTRKVGRLPEVVLEAMQQLSLAQLEDLGEALLDFEGLANLEAWLAQLRAALAAAVQWVTQALVDLAAVELVEAGLGETLLGRVRGLSLGQLAQLREVLAEGGEGWVAWLQAQPDSLLSPFKG